MILAFRTVLSIVVLLLTGVSCTVRADSAAPSWPDIRAAWVAYIGSLDNLQGESTNLTTLPVGTVFKKVETSFRSKGDQGVLQLHFFELDDGKEILLKPDGTAEYMRVPGTPAGTGKLLKIRSEAYLVNNQYSASLKRNKELKDWHPSHFGAANMIDDLERHYVGEMKSKGLPMFHFGPIRLENYLEESEFEITNLQWTSHSTDQKLVRLEFKFAMPDRLKGSSMQLKGGWMELNPRINFLPVRSRGDFDGLGVSWLRTFEYKQREQDLPLVSKCKLQMIIVDKTGEKEGQTDNLTWNLWFDDNVPDREFTLSAFGVPDFPKDIDIPESIGTAVRDLTGAGDATFLERSWVYLLILALGLIGGGLSIFLFIRARKRAMAA